ncbi:DUF2244 domain-containing protein [Zhongshania sp.]|jgi:uncharacterized membrane protein|uniref:DUF2244 domain-containing protein n=1 Tax=Zhongshania sp. TaxID=1971902 RepID=UPI001B48127E|nr:DUF2244 domain-containing protein [Zhongshania sp.]MBQ0795446.1 DUF2244 domain-containing protein [Zhongshania sp.]
MIAIQDHEDSAEIILRPNCSASWDQNRRIIFAVMAVNTLFSAGFIVIGAWLVLPFMGLELLILWLLLSRTFRHLQIQQIVSLSPQTLSIDVGHRRRERSWRWPRNTSYILVTVKPHPWDPLHISLSHCGEQVSIGDFLNKDDSQQLLSTLRRHLPVRHYCEDSIINI